jgi:hypothetical protein
MADVFEKRSDLDSPRARLWKLIEATPREGLNKSTDHAV